MMPEETYEKIVKDLADALDDKMSIPDKFNTIVQVLRANGITGRPLKTLQMVSHLVSEAIKHRRL
jgi:hypothetical protein